MKRIASVLSASFFMLTATVAFSNPYGSNQPDTTSVDSSSSNNCQTKAANNSYDCVVASSFGSPFTDCYEFVSPGTDSVHFDLFPVGLDATLGCSCDPTGSEKKPSFNSSASAFDCDGTDGEEYYDFAGKVSTKKISGHISANNGDSFLFSCTKRSSPCP
jgi:hypothetical protein